MSDVTSESNTAWLTDLDAAYPTESSEAARDSLRDVGLHRYVAVYENPDVSNTSHWLYDITTDVECIVG